MQICFVVAVVVVLNWNRIESWKNKAYHFYSYKTFCAVHLNLENHFQTEPVQQNIMPFFKLFLAKQ